MAQNPTPRRFYIDHAEDRAIVRAVQVQRPAVSPTPVTPATHQVLAVEPDRAALVSKKITDRAKVAPRAVSGLVRSARRHTQRT